MAGLGGGLGGTAKSLERAKFIKKGHQLIEWVLGILHEIAIQTAVS